MFNSKSENFFIKKFEMSFFNLYPLYRLPRPPLPFFYNSKCTRMSPNYRWLGL
ncbi:hypothetical protein HanXRQr2_Chr09g0400101 [Helianthus annuus]|uniref:Uncharacterized protein n=1 Tax=Helianthus annuus TaxID=4232 RepID=A0A251TZ33_HELAN|nr:hypothetical protein HanXRQr2_Chr09g0400101 [Helianthus annuus]KAJ0526913.1 hypothetical protein HanHA300_Chr09g0328411 [Helianthus annuus]KAJ0535476.1 hypothetical protein HanIR_Chr09g0431061 [Helianthus annuus]KAJ0543309.1 hypothetical protein HanHA89_Chr09g0349321 [Helianthus annuus]KAJ0708366.1 hypothetical protein HanLR1_Chr09g0328661 [Helianthus annuus]